MDRVMSQLHGYHQAGLMDAKLCAILSDLHQSYQTALKSSPDAERAQQRFEQLLELIVHNIRHPHTFSIFHQSIRHPFDYYQFGLDFIRPFVDFDHSLLSGESSLALIEAQMQRGDNVVLFANHQTEPDPPIISLLLEKKHPKLACDMIFVAGHRVISDLAAIPMSLGRNLLCIYSKKHIAHPPAQRGAKVLHNQRTLKKIEELLHQGGYCIYVAPSGGRDRPNAAGLVEPAPFDPQSIEYFWLMSRRAAHPTHFYPLALQTYGLMPPPQAVEHELGEERSIHRAPIYMHFGEEIDMEHFPHKSDKHTQRRQRATYIWRQVCQHYHAFPQNLPRQGA